MCFPFDAIVPELPAGFQVMAGGAAGEHLTLTSADGTDFSAYLARAEGPTGVVVLPDVRGLFRFYEQLAERFAAAGHPAIAIDYFGRTAGLGPRDEDFEYLPHVKQTHAGDGRAGRRGRADTLREETGAERAITVGFCFGGAQSFMQAAEGHAGLAGVVGFYGSLERDGPALGARPRARGQGPGARPVRRRRREHHARPGRGVRRGAAGRARDPHLRGRPALVLRPPPGAVQGRIPGRVGTHPGIHVEARDA